MYSRVLRCAGGRIPSPIMLLRFEDASGTEKEFALPVDDGFDLTDP
jgi:hypothetical protein